MDSEKKVKQEILVYDQRSDQRNDQSKGNTIHIHLNNYGQINFIQNNSITVGGRYIISDADRLELELHRKLRNLTEISLERSQARIDEMEKRILQLEKDLDIPDSAL